MTPILGIPDRIESLFQWWTCDMCGRYIWRPILGRHELGHSESEWAAAGYDRAGTLAFRADPIATLEGRRDDR